MKTLAGISMMLAVVLTSGTSEAVDYVLPFPQGEVWQCTQGNNDTPTHHGNLAYAWDFDWIDGDGVGKPIYPPADATVAKIYYDVSTWGNLVVLAYSDGTFGKFAHVLNDIEHPIPVTVGQRVYRHRTVIAYVGGTSGIPDSPYASHIHYQRQVDDSINGQSIPSSFVDVPGDGVPTYLNYYVVGGIGMDEQEGWNGSSRTFLNCFNRLGGIDGVGWPINDGGGIYVHNWSPFRYVVQNFRNAHGEESIIMFDPERGSQAYRISGDVWEFYRHGLNGRYGPDILLTSGKTVSCPTSDYINGEQVFENGYTYKGSVELHELDGTLVYVFEPTGQYSALTASAIAASQNHNVIDWIGGPVVYKYEVFANNTKIGETTLKEFVDPNRTPGDVRTYFVVAKAADGTELDRSNEVTVVSPGDPGSFVLQGVADGYDRAYLQWNDTAFPYAPFHLVIQDGVVIAKSTAGAKSVWPLQPNHLYTFQIAAITASDIVLGYSNEITVTTNQLPPSPPTPDSYVDSVQIHVPQTIQELYSDGYVTATVRDQYGNPMSGVAVLFISSDGNVVAVSAESGYCLFHGLGTAEVWAEVKDARWITSERVTISVVENLPPDPDVFPSSVLRLEQDLVITNPQPYIEYRDFWTVVSISNPTSGAVTFYGPAIFNYDAVTGKVVDFSSYSASARTLQPGETLQTTVSGSRFSGAGNYFIKAQIKLDSDAAAPWYVVDEAALGVNSATYYQVLSESDLRSELKMLSMHQLADEFYEGDSVLVRVQGIDDSNVAVNTPFKVLAGPAGLDAYSIPVASVSAGGIFTCDFDFGPLPAGSYRIDTSIDSENTVLEYDETDNTGSIIVTVLPVPSGVQTMVLCPVSDTVIARDWNDACGQVQDQWSPYLSVATRSGINRYSRVLLDFDLSLLPAYCQIESAQLFLYALTQGEYIGNNFYLDLLAESYDISQVTWCQRTSQYSWQVPGGTWLGLGEAVTYIPSHYTGGWHYQNGGINQWYSWDCPAALQAVANGQMSYQGFILRQEDIANSSENQAVSFASNEYPDSTLTPYLVVRYTISDEPLPKPNLTVNGLAVQPSQLRVGEAATVNWQETNDGDADAPVHQTLVSFGNQSQTVSVPAIPAHGSQVLSCTFTLTQEGELNLTVNADSAAQVAEENEADNLVSATITVSPPLRPDLVVSSINAYLQRGRLMVEVAVGNVGEAQAGYFQLQLVLVESGKTLVVSFDGLAAGASAKKAFALGRYRRSLATFRATVDSGNLIVESDETNNLLVVSKQL